MYIENLEDKKERERQRERENFYRQNNLPQDGETLEVPDDFLISAHSGDTLAHWRAPEFEAFERDRKWYLVVTLALAAIVGYAVFTNSPVMAITFILIGVLGYIQIHKDPRVLDFMITPDGIMAGREMYDFKNLESFWIFYEPEGVKAISLNTRGQLIPYIHIPLGAEDPVRIREILLDFLPEEEKEPGLIETADRLLRL
ncbi:MAG: hypothetical protein A2259_02720 [Candidatus Moranbacteria bacterium RIFOXYA2_FULL_43_15]|nr:MAG: hypothetical protein A2259_02720 [Candidatus Moranbacteria bacterium RIFOXYA2_FULL_43_15]